MHRISGYTCSCRVHNLQFANINRPVVLKLSFDFARRSLAFATAFDSTVRALSVLWTAKLSCESNDGDGRRSDQLLPFDSDKHVRKVGAFTPEALVDQFVLSNDLDDDADHATLLLLVRLLAHSPVFTIVALLFRYC